MSYRFLPYMLFVSVPAHLLPAWSWCVATLATLRSRVQLLCTEAADCLNCILCLPVFLDEHSGHVLNKINVGSSKYFCSL